MIIELRRAHTPEEYGHEEACAICEEPFRVESVRAEISADDTILGPTCPACVGMLGRRDPERFPTLEEYEAANLRYPGPIWGSESEASDAEEHGSRYREVLEANAAVARTASPSPTTTSAPSPHRNPVGELVRHAPGSRSRLREIAEGGGTSAE